MTKIKKEALMGLTLLIVSSLIYTFERFLAVLAWASNFIPVKLSGSGSYEPNPIFPSILENVFVPVFFIMGLILILTSFKTKEKE